MSATTQVRRAGIALQARRRVDVLRRRRVDSVDSLRKDTLTLWRGGAFTQGACVKASFTQGSIAQDSIVQDEIAHCRIRIVARGRNGAITQCHNGVVLRNRGFAVTRSLSAHFGSPARRISVRHNCAGCLRARCNHALAHSRAGFFALWRFVALARWRDGAMAQWRGTMA